MEERYITEKMIGEFCKCLQCEEKSAATIEKYLRDVRAFAAQLLGAQVTKDAVIAYKKKLCSKNYAARSVNSMLASLNSLFSFLGWTDCRVKTMKIQR